MEDTNLILKYIATWNWMLMGVIFLIAATIFFAMSRTITTASFIISYILIATYCFFMSWKRKWEVFKYNE